MMMMMMTMMLVLLLLLLMMARLSLTRDSQHMWEKFKKNRVIARQRSALVNMGSAEE
jgi:hypothetical protein